MSSKFVVQHIPINKIKIPKTRVTSYFEGEALELFKHSIQQVGVLQPLLVAQDGDEYYVIDGYNRLQQALAAGLETVPCVVIKANLKEVMLQNLILNVARGRVKPTEMLQVVATLSEEYGMDADEIARLSGLRKDYIYKLLDIAKCDPEVIAALDDGKISVSHAAEIARVRDPDVQKRLLGITLQYRLPHKDLHEVVNETLQRLEAAKQKQQQEPEQNIAQPVEIPTVQCALCGQDWPVKKVSGVNLCIACYAIAQQAVQQQLQQLIQQAQAAREQQLRLLQKITGEEA